MIPPAHALVVAAHPDDAEFGAAGTVARWTDGGRRVVYALCTSGEKGTTDPTVDPAGLAAVREEEQRAAARLLGVAEVEFLRRPDQGLEDEAGFRREVVRLIRRHRPRILVTSDPYRRYVWHRDHRVAGQVCLDAVFPYARDHLAYPDLLAQGLAPHKVREVWFFASEEPNWWVEVAPTFDRKVAALRCHESQVRELGIPDLDAFLRRRCREAADGTGLELAEAFHRIEVPA